MRRLIILASALALVLAATATAALTAETALPAGNLVKNPGGEVPFGGDFYTRNIAPAVWVKEAVPADERGKGVQVIRYGKDSRLLPQAFSVAIGGGRNFFSGGYPSRIATAFQMIDVSGAAAEIDAGGVKACVSAYLGGAQKSPPTARVDLQFLDEGESALAALRIGPVTRGQRQDVGTLLRRASERAVPAGTRVLKVSFTAESGGGPTNVGYADNISVALIKGGSCDPVLVVKCVKKALVATVNPSAVAATQRVRFAVKGGRRTKVAVDGRAPHSARFTMNGFTGRLTVSAAVSQKGGATINLVKQSKRC
jgi:hypothetical protein